MLFHAPAYLFAFLPAAALLLRASATRPGVWRALLLLAGLAFYAKAGGPALALLLALSAGVFLCVRDLVASAQPARRRAGLVLLCGAPFGVLTAFKLGALGSASSLESALPLGLSFYTFNLVSYGLDVHRRQTPPAEKAAALLSYATFFPTLASGPLLRYPHFRPQLDAPRRLDDALLELGLLRLGVGLAKKVLVADPLGAAIGPLYADYENLGFGDAWLAALGYALQLYFDFSGYTDMARGSAALIGFDTPRNFDAPYAAASITEFWQRWHITLSQWFRDYLFLPLSRALLRRQPEGGDRVRTLCLVLTMVLIGLWHGLSWSFAAWGLYHGLLLAGHGWARRAWPARWPLPLARLVTFLAVVAGWVLMRSASPEMAVRIWSGMLGLHGGFEVGSRGLVWLSVALLLALVNARVDVDLAEPRRTSLQAWAVAALLVLGLFSLDTGRPFLYFRF